MNKERNPKGAGRKKLNKVKRTFSIDADIAEMKPTSKIVNDLLRKEYDNTNNNTNSYDVRIVVDD